MAEQFDYSSAFQINSSIFSTDEQDILRNARVTIVGIGGIGGTMAIILARSGITNFTLFDPDKYEESNSNRQIGCFVDTL
ncbi:MAG: ThiF family adenylyltransferase, partial [Desulfobacterales bacterium]|nr:ThiF family adenylyltransferase [Desulfobacterales bacterium]